MRPLRKLAIGAAVLVAVLLLLLVALPLLFHDRIAARVQAEIAESVNARVHWGSVGLSLLRDFPNVTLRLDDLAVTGVDRFDGDTLVAARQLRVVLDLRSVLANLRRGEPIVVRELSVARPVARLLVLEDGTANWDIVREPSAAGADTGRAVAVSLRELTLRDGDVRYDDRQSKLAAGLDGLELALNGDFTRERFDLGTRVHADAVSLRLAGLPYLDRVALELDTDVQADMRARRFTFGDDRVRLNDLVLAFAGTVGLGDERTMLDLTFSTPSTDFADILSLVPALYGEDFERLQTSGRMSVSGRVQGAYGPDAFPALAVRARVQDGAFRDPDLPLPARDIALDLSLDNPGGDVDSTVVRLQRFHAVLGGRPIDARLVVRTPVSDPEVELRLRGAVDLADLRRTIELEGVDELAGLVAADVALHTRQSWVDEARYDRIAASGTVDLSRVALRADSLPHPVAVDTARLRFTPSRVELATLAARVGRSDVRATGSADNLIGFVLRDEELRGQATLASRLVDLDEWRPEDDSSEVIPVPPNVDLTLRATVDRIRFGTLEFTEASGGLRVKDRRVTLDDFRVRTLGGAVVASGTYETTVAARPTFDLDVRVDSVDIPTAFASLVTVQRLAPVARYARGRVSATLDVAGALDETMTPRFDVLTGQGAFQAARVAIEGFPALVRLADVLHIEQLRNPTLQALQASFRIEDGRVRVQPFDVHAGALALTVAGSHGVDQTLDYQLTLTAPTSLLGARASEAITSLAARAGRAGLQLDSATVVSVGVDVTGTVADPTVRPSFGGTAGSLREGVQRAVQAEVESRVADARQRADSAAEAARSRARAEAARLLAEAEERAATIRREADSLAARVRREGDQKADALVAQAKSPVARIAAQAAADRLRREADAQADRIVQEAGARADALVEEARRRGDALVPPGA
ncbi:MAG TPA: AsmA-like C-terminal region-containing protein [Gemmatimonadaceae bacterium]|nr:AsmA-like C-terminal region-containing protein [Gemmatimonadaceae bacterium]